jgi:hypothetical protein
MDNLQRRKGLLWKVNTLNELERWGVQNIVTNYFCLFDNQFKIITNDGGYLSIFAYSHGFAYKKFKNINDYDNANGSTEIIFQDIDINTAIDMLDKQGCVIYGG